MWSKTVNVLGLILVASTGLALTHPNYDQLQQQPILQATQFGVTADGTTNDYANMVIALASASAQGAVLMLPSGTINIGTNSLYPSSGTRIIGQGPSRSTILYSGTDVAIYVTSGYSAAASLSAQVNQRDETINAAIAPAVDDVLLVGYTDSLTSARRFTEEWDNGTPITDGGTPRPYHKSFTNRVQSVSGGVIGLQWPAGFTIATTSSQVLFLRPVTGIYLADFGVRCNSAVGSTMGIHLMGCVGAVVKNIKVVGSNYMGVSCKNSIGCRYENIHAESTDPVGLNYGFGFLDGAFGNSLDGGYFSNCRHGITIGGSGEGIPTNNIAENLVIASSSQISLDMHGCSFRNTYRNCVVDNGMDISGIGNLCDNIRSGGGGFGCSEGGTDNQFSYIEFRYADTFSFGHRYNRVSIRDSSFLFYPSTPGTSISTIGPAGESDLHIRDSLFVFLATGTTQTQWGQAYGANTAGLFLPRESSVVSCVIDGWPIGLGILGPDCTVRDTKFINCGWDVSGGTPYNSVIFNRGARNTRISGLTIKVSNGFTYGNRLLWFHDTALTNASFPFCSLRDIAYASGSQDPYYQPLFATASYTNMVLENIWLGSGTSNVTASGSFHNTNVATDTY